VLLALCVVVACSAALPVRGQNTPLHIGYSGASEFLPAFVAEDQGPSKPRA
jgi:hypothetical protein